jgi:TetR/AcrR family transcriptional repressor of nem operon
MGIKKSKKTQTRNLIIDTAESLFKLRGIESSGIKKIMNEIGLTVGGFYSHFSSKDELVRTSLKKSLKSIMKILLERSEGYTGHQRIEKILEFYLSTEHSKDIENGCPMAAMSSDLSRCSDDIKGEVEEYLHNFYKTIEKDVSVINSQTNKNFCEEDFFSYLSMSLGAITLSRIIKDEKLANKIINASREKILKEINSPT